MSKEALIVPKKYPVNGDRYTREDRAIFIWFSNKWIKKELMK